MEDISINEIKTVAQTVKEVGGVDFNNYATASFRRRVLRFTETSRIHTITDLLKLIRQKDGFLDNFINEVTVNTTEMFRDPGFWKILRQNVLPALSDKELIRIWHAACSTGEEVLSMAILLKESGLSEKARITATDINEQALEKAKVGSYPLRSQELNSYNYKKMGGLGKLEDYYSVKDTTVVYHPELTRNVIFKKHDLTRDPGLSHYDLILCRNVMIYFNLELQEKVIGTFKNSLLREGYLGIGSKESFSSRKYSRYFRPVSLDEKIYKKII